MSRNPTVSINIRGNRRGLRRELDGAEKDLSGFAKRGSKALSPLQSAGKKLGSSIAGPIMGLAAGVSIFAAGRNIMDFDRKLTRLAIQGKLTRKEQFELREEIGRLGTEAGQSRESILGGLDAIVQRTGDIKFARDVMKDLAVASTATGASMEDLGALASNLQQKFKIGPGGIREALNVLTVQGKAGAFTLENMAAMGERLFSSAGRLGMQGTGDLRQFGALIQAARMGTGSSEQATTAVERTLSSIIEKQDVIKKKAKFDIFTNKKKQQYKGIDQILKGVVAGTKGNEKLLGDIFGEEGVRAVSTIARLYRETGGFALFDELAGADAGRANELMEDYARYSENASFQLARLKSIGERASDAFLSKAIYQFGNSIDNMTKKPAEMEAFIANITTLGAAVGTLVGWLGKGVGAWGKFWEATANTIYGTGEDNIKKQSAQMAFNSLPEERRSQLIKKLKSGEKVNVFDENPSWKPSSPANNIVVENNITVSDTMQVRSNSGAKGAKAVVSVTKKDNSFLVK
jgi:TP901 family phage tail tape measure protein